MAHVFVANFCSNILKHVIPIWHEEIKYIETAAFIQVIMLHCTFCSSKTIEIINQSIIDHWNWCVHFFWNCLEIEIESINYWQYYRINVLLIRFTFQ